MKKARKILVVDDDMDFCEEIKVCLLDLGYEFIFTANNAREALTLVRKERPDVILLDIVMPDIDGDILAERFQENEVTRDIPIVFVTGIISAEEAKVYRDNPNVAHRNFISKPIDPDELQDIIDRLLSSK